MTSRAAPPGHSPEPATHPTGTDPTLDQDLADWWSDTTARPRLSVLGPVRFRAGATAGPAPTRRPYYTELVAFLALHPSGVATGQLTDAFGVEAPTLRKHLVALRAWLGVDPDTGTPFLPLATTSPAALDRGTPLYQLVGMLTDLDLFRRLQARGQAQGAAGLADWEQALALVSGEPFTGQREGGWAWLADGLRHDQLMVCSILDVAHEVTMTRLHTGQTAAARAATETALRAAPHEDGPHLDLATLLRPHQPLPGQPPDAPARPIVIGEPEARTAGGGAPVGGRRANPLRALNRAGGPGQDPDRVTLAAVTDLLAQAVDTVQALTALLQIARSAFDGPASRLAEAPAPTRAGQRTRTDRRL